MSDKQLTSKKVLFDKDDALYGLLKSIKTNADNDYYVEMIDPIHQAVHDKKMHTISYTKEDVDSDGTLLVRIVATTKDIHARFAYTGEGKTRLRSYVSATYTANGAVYVPFNRQTGEASNVLANVYIDPTVDVIGPVRGNDFIGTGGATPARVGGTGAADVETVINAGTELLLEIVNAAIVASDLNFIGNIYEREPIV